MASPGHVLQRQAGSHLLLAQRGTTEQMLEAQFDAAMGRHRCEETGAVKLGLSQTTNKVAHAEATILELGLELHGTVLSHHVAVAEHMAVGGMNRQIKRLGINRSQLLERDDMGPGGVIARADGMVDRLRDLALEIWVR